MSKFIKAVAIAAVLAAPVASFAQSNGAVTRAEVRHQLVQVERAGYNPARNDATYPATIQAAEKRVYSNANANSAGGVADGSSQAGHRAIAPVASPSVQDSLYSHS